MKAQDIFNNYGNFFQNGKFSNGEPILYKLIYYIAKDGDDFAIVKQEGSESYTVAHNCDIDGDNFTISWCWGHYDFRSVGSAKKYINAFYKNKF